MAKAKSLSVAIQRNDLGAVRKFLADGAALNPRDVYQAPITDAAGKSDPTFVELLAAAGARVNLRYADRSTPLMVSAAKGYADTVRALLQHGADPDARDCFGRTALHYAADGNHLDAVRALLAGGANPDIKSG